MRLGRRRSLVVVCCITANLLCMRTRAAENTIVPFQSQWRFLNPQGSLEVPEIADPEFETTWFTNEYNDAFPIEWSGPATAPFSYGGVVALDGFGTELQDPGDGERFTAYFRHQFTTDTSLSDLSIDFIIDDGAVFYLDGEEVARDSCCVDGQGNAVADSYRSLSPFIGFEDTVRRLPLLTSEPLAPGNHVLAVSLHQADPVESSDLGFIMRLVQPIEPDLPLISAGENWKLFRGVEEPSQGTAWTRQDFDDRQWEFVKEGVGYDVDINTLPFFLRVADTGLNDMVEGYSTTYLRKPFEVPDATEIDSLELSLDYDDSFIAYINGVEVTRSAFGTPGTPEPFDGLGSSHESTNGFPDALLESFEIDLADFPGLLNSGSDNVLAIHGLNTSLTSSDFLLADITLGAFTDRDLTLQPGDANRDLQFDQLDLVQVQVASKYLSGRDATWGEGDWNGGPGGTPEDPPEGDGVFNQLDIVAAQVSGVYLTGPYAASANQEMANNPRVSLTYDPDTGEISVDPPAGSDFVSINIDSANEVFTGDAAIGLDGGFDNDADGNLFKATFGGTFGTVHFGNVAQTGLTRAFLLGDLSVFGALANGTSFEGVQLTYVPEPSACVLLFVGVISLVCLQNRRVGS